ncbi:F0F1 ATP synthase subunit delta, partial [Streptomyces chartreusis]
KLYGHTMHLNIDVDPEVVGGIRVQVGDEVINGSLADRIEDAGRRLAG